MFAGCLLADKEGEGAQELRQLASPKLHVVQLDVTKQEDWDKTRDYIKSHARSHHPAHCILFNLSAQLRPVGDCE